MAGGNKACPGTLCHGTSFMVQLVVVLLFMVQLVVALLVVVLLVGVLAVVVLLVMVGTAGRGWYC